MPREIFDLEKKLTQINIPLPNVHVHNSFIDWQTTDDVHAQLTLAKIFFKKESFADGLHFINSVFARISCYETVEEEANHTRHQYVGKYLQIRRNLTPRMPLHLVASFEQRLEDVERAESRLLREYSLLQKPYAQLREDVVVYCGESLVELCLPRPQEARIVLEHINELYNGLVN